MYSADKKNELGEIPEQYKKDCSCDIGKIQDKGILFYISKIRNEHLDT